MDARREKLAQWKLQKAKEKLMIKTNNNNQKKKKSIPLKKQRSIAKKANAIGMKNNNNSMCNKNVTMMRKKKMKKMTTTTIASNNDDNNNMKRKHIGMDKENQNNHNITVRKRNNFITKKQLSSLIIENGKDKNDFNNNKKKKNEELLMKKTTTTETQTYFDENLEEEEGGAKKVKNNEILTNNNDIGIQTVFQFQQIKKLSTSITTSDKGIEALPIYNTIGTSTVEDGENNESSHYTTLLNQLNDKKLELKEKDATINRLKFANQVTIQQMGEIQDELNDSLENEEMLKMQLEKFKTQLVMNLQIAVQKNKELKDENIALKTKLEKGKLMND